MVLTLVSWFIRRRKRRRRLGLDVDGGEGVSGRSSLALMRRSESERYEEMRGYGWVVDDLGTPRRSGNWERK